MTPRVPTRRAIKRALALVLFLHTASVGWSARELPEAELIEKEQTVDRRKPAEAWQEAKVSDRLLVRDRLRTGELSRAAVRLTDLSVFRLDELTTIEISAPETETTKARFDLERGGAYFFGREKPRELEIRTPGANAALRGTEFVIRVDDRGKTTVAMLEGEVELSNPLGRVLLRNGEQGEAAIGQAPRKTAMIEAVNIIQWCLYYPGVLDLEEIALTASDKKSLAASLAAYRSGDLLAALSAYPRGRSASEAERVFRAALWLQVGQVDRATADLARLGRASPQAAALRQLIAAVKFQEFTREKPAETASGWMAESYYQQSRSNLEAALDAARTAASLAPNFGFAWSRVAELEFSFGRTAAARKAIERGLELMPRNAQAHAVRGFLLAAENRIGAAQESFQTALELDGALGNAWLGRGLCAIRRGKASVGGADLLAAAAIEPNRSLLRSYLGKAFSQTGPAEKARTELQRAEELDPNDPTPLLYSAIEKKQENRYNEAIEDLEKSIMLNDNRRVYRSRLLLDQDLSVRNANLASIYQDNGMTDVAVREATRAVENDYTNASSHLFLANSFDVLRDPTRISLRYETAWFNELLLAHLLSPVGGGPLSQFVSQQEYSKLFQADGLGMSLIPEWRSDGRLYEQASFYGTFGNFSFGIDAAYFYDNGRRPNNEVSREEIYWQAKFQVTPNDILYTFGQWQDNETGDLFQSYFDQPGSLGVDFEEKQEPGQLLVGWNHRWAPGVHTLLLGGRLAAAQVLTDPATRQLLLFRANTPELDQFFAEAALAREPPVIQNSDSSLSYSKEFLKDLERFTGRGVVTSIFPNSFTFATQRQFEIYSGEIQQLWETSHNTLILGARWQAGEFETNTGLTLLDPVNQFLFSIPAANQRGSVDFERQTYYAYDFLKVAPWLTLIGGVTWDEMDHPENFRNPPVSQRSERDRQFSGKGGFTFSPGRWLTMRGIYSEGMGGVTFEDSVRLEPVQLAGFNQSFRTIISESVAGSVEAPRYTNWGISVEGSLPTKTWWAASLNILEEDVERTVGAFDGFAASVFPAGAGFVPGGTTESLAYREEVVTATLNQLIGREFALAARYRYTRAELRDTFSQLRLLGVNADRLDEAVLHELDLAATWNSPSGLFARTEARWYSQDLDGTVGGIGIDGLPGDDFWQFDAQVGYRFARNRCEVSAGVLNITDGNYQLSPLTYTDEIPRARTFVVRYRMNF